MSRAHELEPPDLRDRRDVEIEEDARAPQTVPQVARADHRTQLIVEYERASAASPADPTVHLKFGRAALAQGLGLEAEAVESLTKYTALAPDAAEGHYYLGLAHAARGSYDEAARSYLRALELDPDDPDFWLALHFANFSRHQFAEARNCIERAARARIVGQEPGIDPHFFSCWLGINLLLSGDDTTAEPLLRAATQSEGRIGDAAHYALGLLAIRHGDARAVELHREALKARESALQPALAAAQARGTIEAGEAVQALTGRL